MERLSVTGRVMNVKLGGVHCCICNGAKKW
jgi:hypothetical protein